MSGALQVVFQNQRSFVSVPGAPTIGTATATGLTTATVSYTAPANNGGSTITLYTATSSPGGITGTLATAGSGTINVSGLTTGTSYTFTVTATNSVGTSAASAASNSVTPVALGFLATEVFSGTNNRSRYVAVNSSGTIYKLPEGQRSLIQYSSTGTQNWNRSGYVGQSAYVTAVDSSNNYYIGGQFTSFNGQISKYNSSDTLQWSTSFVTASGDEVVYQMARPVIDSSGNVYVGYQGSTNTCCGALYQYYMTKFNSSGTIQNAQSLSFGADGADYGQTVGVGVDSSGNFYNMLGAIFSGYGAVALYQHNSSGTRLASKFILQSPSGGVDAYDYLFDTANSVGYFVGNTSSGTVFKHDTSLASIWAYAFTDISSFFGVALDSSGNIYAVGQQGISNTNGPLRIIKLNSSGTLQWARTLSLAGYRVENSGGFVPRISISGSKFVVSATVTDNASITRAFTFQAPTDGSGTGTISNAGLSWVYSSLTTSATSKAVNYYSNGSTSAATRTATSRTPTIAASSWVSTVTSF